jgi:hypothetical protein
MSVDERGPKELIGMVELTRDQAGRVNARLLDLAPGRSGAACRDWLALGDTQKSVCFSEIPWTDSVGSSSDGAVWDCFQSVLPR